MTLADTALAVIEMARRGDFTGISDKFLPQLRALAPPEALRAAWDAELARNGQVSALGTPLTEPAPIATPPMMRSTSRMVALPRRKDGTMRHAKGRG